MSPAQARQSLRNMLDRVGETVTLRRVAGASAGDYDVLARVMQADPSDVVGAVQQLKRKAIVDAEAVASSGFPTPFLPKQDRLVWQGKVLVITAIDDSTRRIQGELIGYVLELSGA